VDISITEARKRLSQLIRAVESGEQVIITCRGKAVTQISPPPAARRKVVSGGMKGKIKFYPGGDDPIDEDRFLAGH
jgi:antitoxin (DNA-binding transcriptional repressor) of toxin-antitoxin stability system